MSHEMPGRSVPRGWIVTAVVGLTMIAATVGTWAIITDIAEIGRVHEPNAEHADQAALNAGTADERFEQAFELGDELFATLVQRARRRRRERRTRPALHARASRRPEGHQRVVQSTLPRE